jgi:hypothetical protein
VLEIKNLEMPVYFLKEKQAYTARKMERKINGLMYSDKCCASPEKGSSPRTSQDMK